MGNHGWRVPMERISSKQEKALLTFAVSNAFSYVALSGGRGGDVYGRLILPMTTGALAPVTLGTLLQPPNSASLARTAKATASFALLS